MAVVGPVRLYVISHRHTRPRSRVLGPLSANPEECEQGLEKEPAEQIDEIGERELDERFAEIHPVGILPKAEMTGR